MLPDKTILCVDDDEDDVEFLSEALLEINPGIKIKVAENGLKALDYLEKVRSDTNNFPCLIVLDLNMPYLDGKQTFQKIKADPVFQNVPIIIFTSSKNPNDKSLFNNLGIQFITKPNSISDINKIADEMLSNC